MAPECDVFRKIESGSKEHLPILGRRGGETSRLSLHPSCVALVKNALPFSERPTIRPECESGKLPPPGGRVRVRVRCLRTCEAGKGRWKGGGSIEC